MKLISQTVLGLTVGAFLLISSCNDKKQEKHDIAMTRGWIADFAKQIDNPQLRYQILKESYDTEDLSKLNHILESVEHLTLDSRK